jgi:hypothetical protein
VIDPMLRIAALTIVGALILAPVAVVLRSREAIALLCRELTSSVVAICLSTSIVAIGCRIYLDGVRLGWWSAIADALAGWWDHLGGS